MNADSKKHILMVDDEQSVLDSLRRILRPERHHWEMRFVNNPLTALELLQSERFDALVSDVRMPQLSGLELLKRLKGEESTKHIPVVILTGEADRSLKRSALDLGATDLLNKPVDREDLVARIRNVLKLRAYQEELFERNKHLEDVVNERTKELAASRVEIVWRLGKAAEYRDEETGHHVIRVGWYSREIARSLGTARDFADTLFLAAPLHDLGKIAIPDSILRKRGRLTPEEWSIMQQHSKLGADILCDNTENMPWFTSANKLDFDNPSQDIQATNPLLEMARSIALCHHEKWDGSGYPQGLVGEEIPLEARIVAIADTYDALRSCRPYKEAFSEEKSLAILAEGSGQHFDPSVHEAFLDGLDQIRRIQSAYTDRSQNSNAECCVC